MTSLLTFTVSQQPEMPENRNVIVIQLSFSELSSNLVQGVKTVKCINYICNSENNLSSLFITNEITFTRLLVIS